MPLPQDSTPAASQDDHICSEHNDSMGMESGEEGSSETGTVRQSARARKPRTRFQDYKLQ